MAFVRVEQRNAHLAGAVRLNSVEGRDGPISKATLTAISNTRRGSGDNRGEEATAIQWTLWGKQAENAAQYLGKGSHINVVGRETGSLLRLLKYPTHPPPLPVREGGRAHPPPARGRERGSPSRRISFQQPKTGCGWPFR